MKDFYLSNDSTECKQCFYYNTGVCLYECPENTKPTNDARCIDDTFIMN